jgi:signal transduction histidine kinase
MRTEAHRPASSGLSFVQAILVAIALVLLLGWLKIGVFSHRVFPLSAALPLLFCLYHRDLRILHGMAGALSIVAFIKVFVMLPPEELRDHYHWIVISSHLTNIWLVAGVVHGLIVSLRHIAMKQAELSRLNEDLEHGNEELLASNEELAAREEEITRQNEELRSQSEELEQQAEELRQQAEEMEQQGAEILHANQELIRKERGLHTLLDSGRWLRGDSNEILVLNGVCQAAVQVLGDEIQAAAVLFRAGSEFAVKGDFGFGLHGAAGRRIEAANSFSALMLESGMTASVNDLHTRPDLVLPRSSVGPPFRSVLGSPIWLNGGAVGTLEIYTTTAREWTEHEFRIVEWLAVQTAVGLQAIEFRRELEQKKQDAEDASIQKTNFLAAVSHDIRNPVNAISLLAEVIERCSMDPAKVARIPELSKSLWNNARSLVELVSDVLDLTRLEAGILDLSLSDFSLCELIREEVEKALPQAESKNLKLECRLPAGEIRLLSDRIKVARIIANLIGNAVKFTEHGGITIDYSREEDGRLLIHVRDTGIGIPSEQVEHVFDEFMQGRNPERNREKGTGLGLAICRSLVRSLGFDIGVKSLIGVGSTFTVEIPAGHLASDRTGNEAAPQGGSITVTDSAGSPGPPILEGTRVLLVEDHEVAREMTTQLLESEGAVVDTAANGREAIRHLSSGRHQVLLLDLNLPDFDGIEVLQNLRKTRPESLRVVLVVSGDVRPERITQVTELGADGLVGKPVSLQKLKEALAGKLVA